MKQRLLGISLFLGIAFGATAQDKFFTKTGKVFFDATVAASPEAIAGVNKSLISVLDTKTGNFQFSLQMKGFEFERALMQEHFNENYVESDKFPKADFKGVIANNANVNYGKDGNYAVTVKGKFTIHGVSRDAEATGTLAVKGGKIRVKSGFGLLLSDYGVTIPQLVADKVAKTAKITVDCDLEPLNK